MIAESNPATMTSEQDRGVSGRISNLAREVGPRWADFWDAALEAAGAQANIAQIKAERAVALAGAKAARAATFMCLGLTAISALLALAVYGFILLNRVFDYVLRGPDIPPWVSPLVRGLLYFGIPAIALGIMWSFGASKSEIEKEADQEKAAADSKKDFERREACRGA